MTSTVREETRGLEGVMVVVVVVRVVEVMYPRSRGEVLELLSA